MNIKIKTTIVGELTMNPREQYVYTQYVSMDIDHQEKQPSRPMIYDIWQTTATPQQIGDIIFLHLHLFRRV